ncbi:TonB-dependent receptor SusC [Adhaeribacter pallidiroseus]|uniref:TonB-dependent receptor SusC n=2 Tax=Adhaeribacter pallidiroseus TaxID=2072847 RepID=A0A369QUF4_9BACT|nr:TonB-dependent receptor SusC [Adhaeribacter pallidiroseus]
MQPDTSKWLLPDDGHPSLEQLRLYQQDEELPARSRHQVEKHLLDCELCSDILAGMAVSNRAQTQAAVIQINQKIKKRIESGQQKKVRPMYVPLMRAAAAIVILVISAGLLRYLQQSDQSPVSEKSSIAQNKPNPVVTIPEPVETPVIKPIEPEPQVAIKPMVIPKTEVIAQAKTKTTKPAKQITPAADKPQELTFPIDSAVVLDAFAVKAEDTPRIGFTNSESPNKVSGSVDLQGAFNKVASSLARKKMDISMQQTNAFTGRTVMGKVTDTSGEPLAGANVIVNGTTTGTTTDAAGKFILNVPPGKEALTFNYIGYETQEQKINANIPLAVQLKEDQRSLQEVAVVGYGAAKDGTVEVTRAKPQPGRQAFNQYIRENLRYPVEARQQKQEGRVEVGFTVTEQGALTNFKILKSLNPTCDAEAIRVIKEGPAWQPTVMQGQPQPENVQVSVRFKL